MAVNHLSNLAEIVVKALTSRFIFDTRQDAELYLAEVVAQRLNRASMQCAVKVMKHDIDIHLGGHPCYSSDGMTPLSVFCHQHCIQIGFVPSVTAGVLLRVKECLICLCVPWGGVRA